MAHVIGKPRGPKDHLRCMVYVQYVDNGTVEGLKGLFERYGPVKSVVLPPDKQYAFIEFEDENTAQAVIGLPTDQSPVWEGRRLKLKQRTRAEGQSKCPIPQPMLDVPINGATLSEQANHLAQYFVQSPASVTEHRLLATNMQAELQLGMGLELGRFTVAMFGSSVTGLDLYQDIDLSAVTEHECDRATAQKYVGMAASILKQAGYGHVRPIRKAKCPVVKFSDKASSLPMDMTFSNRLGVRNSRLIKAYFRAHTALRTVLLVLKVWRAACRFEQPNTYTLAIMAIHLMQARHWLPCLQERSEFDSTNDTHDSNIAANGKLNVDWLTQPGECVIDSWDCYFRTAADIHTEPGPEKIIQEFFDYYCSFDFGTNFVQISNQSQASSYFERYTPVADNEALTAHDKPNKMKMRCPVCVQDPFELLHNTAAGMHLNHYEYFTAQMAAAKTVLSAGGNLQDLINSTPKLGVNVIFDK